MRHDENKSDLECLKVFRRKEQESGTTASGEVNSTEQLPIAESCFRYTTTWSNINWVH